MSDDITIDDNGYESHPSYGMAVVNRVSSTPPVSLFDSEIRHSHYVVLRIETAARKRDLNHDWIHSRRKIVEVAMSFAQWGALVSSFNTSGEPCTIDYADGKSVDQPDHAPRMALSIAETEGAADRAFDQIKDGFAKIEAAFAAKASRKEISDLLHSLHHVIGNATPNVRYAASTLTEHVENTVTKAKADIEAMVDYRARELGIDPGDVKFQLGDGSDG